MRAKAPSTTANLGPGFDVFGLALDAYYDEVEVEVNNEQRQGIVIESNANIPLDARSNSAGYAVLKLCKDFDINEPLKIKIRKGIPAGYGLGSSGASASAAVKAMDSLFKLNLSNEELIRYAAYGEQASAGSIHYDNVAASMLGGFVIVRSNPLKAIRFEPPDDLLLCIAIPKIKTPSMKTMVARNVLPDKVALKDMVSNLANASMIVAGFALKDTKLIAESINDIIIEPARASIIKGYHEVKSNALKAGALAVTISGAGPSMIAFVNGNAEKVKDAMINGFKAINIDADAIICKANKEGTVII